MTTRARFLLAIAFVGLSLGTLRSQALLSLISFSTIFWIIVQGWRFRIWLRWELPNLQVVRLINGRAEVETLWAGRTADVEVRLTTRRASKLNIRFRDYVPEQLEIQSLAPVAPINQEPSWTASPTGASSTGQRTQQLAGQAPTEAPWLTRLRGRGNQYLRALLDDADPLVAAHEVQLLAGQQSVSIGYRVKILSAGKLKLPGVRLVLEDLFGLFREHRFFQAPRTFTVLPSYHRAGEMRPTIKRHNSLPRHGIHRLQRSGMGSELLELREYVAGDPPKSIAWKVSARRDKLLTRQYESEVPVRVHLIVDGSVPTRIGGFGLRLLDQINYVAASVAQAAIAVGDPVDCWLVDEGGVRRLPWFAGDSGLLKLLRALADFSLQAPPTTGPISSISKMMALTVCHERYPELLNPRLNCIPWMWRTDYRRRFRMLNVISQLYDLPLQEHIGCLLSDEPLGQYLQRFLHDAGMPWMAPLLPAPDEPITSATARMESISQNMVRALMHAQDNEVFVIMADLFSAAPHFQSLQRAVKLAIAKHHRVAFVCPTSTFLRPKQQAVLPGSESIADLLLAAERTRIRDLAVQVKQELSRLGAAVSFSGEKEAIGMVLAEIDTARSGRSHLRRPRS